MEGRTGMREDRQSVVVPADGRLTEVGFTAY